jgi:bifunctional ADP-heptose synthase (sugar kinase/adenylyltransferase)
MALNVEANLLAFPTCTSVYTNQESVTKERFVDIRSKQHLLRCDFGENYKLTPMSLEKVASIEFHKYDAVVISDYNKGYLDAEVNKGESNDIIVTLGERGVQWNNNVFPTTKVEVFDVSGAGDTFLAALVYGFLKSSSLERALKFANKCASVVVQKSGTYAITAEDLVKNDICI